MNRKWMYGKRLRILRQLNKWDIFSDPKFLCNACERLIRHAIDSPRHGADVLEMLDVVGGGFRPDEQCPFCFANDRLRFTIEVLGRYTDILTTPCRVLEIAPIKGLKVYLDKHARCEYLSGDIMPGYAQRVLDITRLDLPDKSFDYVICCHVLEHIEDEAAALGEIRRVLKYGGCALLSMPISLSLDETLEDAAVDTPEERLSAYGQRDHVRLYGTDVKKRIARSGFEVREIIAGEVMPEAVKTLKLIPADRNYLCYKV